MTTPPSQPRRARSENGTQQKTANFQKRRTSNGLGNWILTHSNPTNTTYRLSRKECLFPPPGPPIIPVTIHQPQQRLHFAIAAPSARTPSSNRVRRPAVVDCPPWFQNGLKDAGRERTTPARQNRPVFPPLGQPLSFHGRYFKQYKSLNQCAPPRSFTRLSTHRHRDCSPIMRSWHLYFQRRFGEEVVRAECATGKKAPAEEDDWEGWNRDLGGVFVIDTALGGEDGAESLHTWCAGDGCVLIWQCGTRFRLFGLVFDQAVDGAMKRAACQWNWLIVRDRREVSNTRGGWRQFVLSLQKWGSDQRILRSWVDHVRFSFPEKMLRGWYILGILTS